MTVYLHKFTMTKAESCSALLGSKVGTDTNLYFISFKSFNRDRMAMKWSEFCLYISHWGQQLHSLKMLIKLEWM